MISQPFRRASSSKSGPAITMLSLLARASRLPLRAVSNEGKSPAAPAMPLTTISASLSRISRSTVSVSVVNVRALYRAASSASSSLRECAVIISVVNSSECESITERVLRPIVPVAPRTMTFFFISDESPATVQERRERRKARSQENPKPRRVPSSECRCP